MFIPSEHMIGGLTVVIREHTVPNRGKLYRIKIMSMVTCYSTRLFVLKDMINFLSVNHMSSV